jgi:hypothetical protein
VPSTRWTRPTIAQDIAPHVEEAWADAFVLEARLLDVPGGYARSIAELAPRPRASVLPHLGPLALEIAGLVTVITAVGELARGGQVAVTWGVVAMLAVLLVGCGAVAVVADRLLGFVVRRPVVAAAAFGAAATAVLVPSVLLLQWEAPLVVVPAPLAGGVGLALLAGGIAATLLLDRRGRLADPVVGPGQTARRARSGLGLMPWTVLAWTAIGSVVVWVVAR